MTDFSGSIRRQKTLELRDGRRPRLDDVVRVVHRYLTEDLSVDIVPVETGPVSWTWEERTDEIVRTFAVTTSCLPDLDGYPLVTIRQAFSEDLDSWITVSGVLPGLNDEALETSMKTMIASHIASTAGFRYALNMIVAADGNPMAGLAAASSIFDAAATVQTSAQVMSALKRFDDEPAAENSDDLDEGPTEPNLNVN